MRHDIAAFIAVLGLLGLYKFLNRQITIRLGYEWVPWYLIASLMAVGLGLMRFYKCQAWNHVCGMAFTLWMMGGAIDQRSIQFVEGSLLR